jgi:hypothetical protein
MRIAEHLVRASVGISLILVLVSGCGNGNGTPATDGTVIIPDKPLGWTKLCVGNCKSKADCPASSIDCVNGTCVACKSDTNCDSSFKGGCDTVKGRCRQCKTDADCSNSGIKIQTGQCNADGMCMKCSADTDCTSLPGGLYSGCLNGTCALCKIDADCPMSGPNGCDPMTGTCTMCKADTECCPAGTASCPLKCNVGKCACEDDGQCKTVFGTTSTLQWSCK